MSTSAITSSLLSQITSSTPAANKFATDLNQVAGDLQSGNLAAAQEDYVTLSSDALNGGTSSSATTTSSGITSSLLSNIAASPSASNSFVTELNQVGTDLENGDLSSAQGDMLTLSSTALNLAASLSTSSTTGAGASATSQSASANIKTDISAIILAMSAGDTADVSSEMQQLAQDAENSSGTNYFKIISGSSNASSTASAASSTDPTTALLQSLDDTQANTNSLLASDV